MAQPLSHHHKTTDTGFTLVEVMIVMLIIGLMASFVVLKFPNSPNPIYKQGQKMASHLQRVAQTSLIESQSYGVSIDKEGYSVVRFESQEWQEIMRHDFGFENAPKIEFSQNGAVIDLDKINKANAPTIMPVIRYDTTGIATPFTLKFETPTAQIHLVGNIDSQISLSMEGS